MKKTDYFFQNWRYSIVEPLIPTGCELLDIGGFDGSFLLRVHDKISKGFCIDPLIIQKKEKNLEFIKAKVTERLPFQEFSFDVVVMLAVFEHLGTYQDAIISESFRILRPQGLAILTVPNRFVDYILKVLIKCNVIDGMSLEEHSYSKSSDIINMFLKRGFTLKHWSKFQLGLNNLFIFKK
jgi:ubiquinone/menaquinone biosynthesis C-methylase UbiE